MTEPRPRTQYGALPYEIGPKGRLRVLLVTSRGTGRWIIPKGWPMRFHRPHKAAAREAFEEAGVLGRTSRKSIGTDAYMKTADDGEVFPCRVTVFPMVVTDVGAVWPEEGQRRRRWFTPEQAAKRVDEPELQKILRDFKV